ncbi:tetratricopeptide repeat protein [Hyphococcus sp.]|uniref:tetratricopeptide repeat protein n=1 Tax=Hyphococcus sp. TaxID=2038636 RepID=UPI003CCBD9B2
MFRFISLRIVIAIAVLSAGPAGAAPEFSAEDYRADIQFLRENLKQRHVAPFDNLSEAEFDTELDALAARAGDITFNEFIVALARIGAGLKEGHTGHMPAFDGQLDLPILPVELFPVSDGMALIAAHPDYEVILGAEVMEIGGVAMEEIAAAMAPLYSRDTDAALPKGVAALARAPALLEGAGVVDSAQDAHVITIRKNGRRTRVQLQPMSKFETMGRVADTRFVVAGGDPAPRWLRDRNNPWLRDRLDNGRAMYFQFNSADTGRDDERNAEDFRNFIDEMVTEIENDPSIERMIVDMRWNAGGSYNNTKQVLPALIATGRFGERGDLYILTSPMTFSAASLHTEAFENWMAPIIVGMAGAGRPAHFAELGRFRLPRTQLEFRFSIAATTDSREHRPAFAPHLAVWPSAADIRAGRDPVLDAAIQYDPETDDLRAVLKGALREGGAAALRETYLDIKSNEAGRYIFEEAILSDIGEDLFLNDKNYEQALAVFQLNAEHYPWSPEVYNNLAHAYRALEEKQAAIENFEKAMAIDVRYGYALPMVRTMREEIAEGD